MSLDTVSSKLRDLILRNNDYDTATFSNSSRLFDGVRRISGRLDLQYSRLQLNTSSAGSCLFEVFDRITDLDLSFVQFLPISKQSEVPLTRLLQCRNGTDRLRRGEQLLYLSLRQLNLQRLPDLFNNDRFPFLRKLDLSGNQIRSINLNGLTNLRSLSLAHNPIELQSIVWRQWIVYDSLDLSSTTQNRTYNLTKRLKNLFRLSTNIDYSDNRGDDSFVINKFPISLDFSSSEFALNLSRNNITSFKLTDFSPLDNLHRLDLSDNRLTQLNLEEQSKLTHLQCSNQNLTSLTLSKYNSRLVTINCSRNSLKTIENFAAMPDRSLKSIDFSSNLIETVDDLLGNLTSRYLQTIYLQWNRIRKISTNLFHPKLISLYSIDLSHNRIETIEARAFQAPNLQILDLTGNPLKRIASNFLFAPALRLFFLVNQTQDLVDRCARSDTDDTLLLTYISWFEQNGTYMKNTRPERSAQIQSDQCLRRYTSRSKVKWMKVIDQKPAKHLSLYIIMAAISVGIVLGVIHLYRKNKWALLTGLQRYRPLDRNGLVENIDNVNRQPDEDEEIAMNLNEPPFNGIHRA